MNESVKEIITHILYHVNAESRESDPSQVGDVQGRAAYVRSVLQRYESDARKLEKYDLLREVSRDAAANPQRDSFRRLLSNLEVNDNTSPRAALQEWVATGEEGEKP